MKPRVLFIMGMMDIDVTRIARFISGSSAQYSDNQDTGVLPLL